MEVAVWGILGILLTTGAVSTAVRQVVKRAIGQYFDAAQLRLKNDLALALKTHEAAIDSWAGREMGRFKFMMEASSGNILELTTCASKLRRAMLGIGAKREQGEVEGLYGHYCKLFYGNPVLPPELFAAAHKFRRAADEAIGACRVLDDERELAPVIANTLNETFALLRQAAASVLLPDLEAT